MYGIWLTLVIVNEITSYSGAVIVVRELYGRRSAVTLRGGALCVAPALAPLRSLPGKIT
jgi:hypothetical protein